MHHRARLFGATSAFWCSEADCEASFGLFIRPNRTLTPKTFLARAFVARKVLKCSFRWRRTPKQDVRELVLLALFCFFVDIKLVLKVYVDVVSMDLRA